MKEEVMQQHINSLNDCLARTSVQLYEKTCLALKLKCELERVSGLLEEVHRERIHLSHQLDTERRHSRYLRVELAKWRSKPRLPRRRKAGGQVQPEREP